MWALTRPGFDSTDLVPTNWRDAMGIFRCAIEGTPCFRAFCNRNWPSQLKPEHFSMA